MVITKKELVKIIKEEVRRAVKTKSTRRSRRPVRRRRRRQLPESVRRRAYRKGIRFLREGGEGSGRMGRLVWSTGKRKRPGRPTKAEKGTKFWDNILSDLHNENEPAQSIVDRIEKKIEGPGRASDEDMRGIVTAMGMLEELGFSELAARLEALIEPSEVEAKFAEQDREVPSRRGRPRHIK